ncbi:MAG: AraC family transcriptional regulator [Clostridiales bacterium]|nr:AraC family transcriptional regulator [Clostridiales bacterium]
MNFLLIEALWPEEQNFVLHRDNIGEQYIFIHFLTPVTAILKGETVDIEPGGCVFFGKNSMQHFSSQLCSLLHDWFHADSSCGELMEKYGLECETVYYPSDSDEITRIITEIELEYINKAPHFAEAASAAAEQLFIKLSRSKESTPAQPVDLWQKERFIQARSKIHMDICRQWTAEDMAKLVNMSPSRFYYLYKKMFGISPQKDLIRKRIQTAQMLLCENSFTVCQVARLCGYNNPYHFIRQFKQITGTTPGKTSCRTKK